MYIVDYRHHIYLLCAISTITFRLRFLHICDVTKQNGHCSVGTLYREALGEIVLPMITFIYSKKGEGEHIVYDAIQVSLVVLEFKISVCFPHWNVFCAVMVRVLLLTFSIFMCKTLQTAFILNTMCQSL